MAGWLSSKVELSACPRTSVPLNISRVHSPNYSFQSRSHSLEMKANDCVFLGGLLLVFFGGGCCCLTHHLFILNLDKQTLDLQYNVIQTHPVKIQQPYIKRQIRQNPAKLKMNKTILLIVTLSCHRDQY